MTSLLTSFARSTITEHVVVLCSSFAHQAGFKSIALIYAIHFAGLLRNSISTFACWKHEKDQAKLNLLAAQSFFFGLHSLQAECGCFQK